MTKPRYALTTPIYYVNDKPHIGHAYTTLACDVLARFKRLDGFAVHFLTGTDEHGQKVQQSAAKRGMAPGDFVDALSQSFRDLARAMGSSHDDFIRTSEPRHHAACQALWQRLVERDAIYLGSYAGWYAVRDEAFYAESETEVDESGQRVAPSGAPVEWLEEESYFFRLSAYQDRLLALYEAQPDFILPGSRRNEVISFVKSGLQDLSISRTSFDWGIAVPGDPAHVIYVWIDALTNYITALGYPDEEAALFQRFWPADLHVVGKDILRFHAVYWPAILMAAELPLPGRIFAHGWWTNEGQKISKSLGNVIDPYALIDRFGLDQTRYFLLREVPFGSDGDFAQAALIARMNADLANVCGNLAQRVLAFIYRHYQAEIPALPTAKEAVAQELQAQADALLDEVRELLDQQAFSRALERIWALIAAANVAIDREAPWQLQKHDPARAAAVLARLVNVIRQFSLLLQPFMPTSAGKLLDALSVPDSARDFTAYHQALPGGTSIPKPEPLFARYQPTAANGDSDDAAG